ncbi:unnamed protein product [Ilex paraguariensis]|uniref:OTU domain-containing protein n=1 Tax=Ilex paraguariensis TaxID=185542 RepID=A0ABC8UUH0_9AQUA
MTRILVQRGSVSSSNPNRPSSSVPSSSSSSSSSAPPQPQVTITSPQVVSTVKNEELAEEVVEQVVMDELCDSGGVKNDDLFQESLDCAPNDNDAKIVNSETVGIGIDDVVGSGDLVRGLSGLRVTEEGNDRSGGSSLQAVIGSSCPPPPPVPPPKPSSTNSNLRRFGSDGSNPVRIGSSRRAAAWPVVITRTSPTGSRPSSPRSHCENEGYNSADEQNPCFGSSYGDAEREREFEIDIRRIKGLEVKRMLEDGNCLFRAVADQVYGDSEVYDLVRQMCIDYMV